MKILLYSIYLIIVAVVMAENIPELISDNAAELTVLNGYLFLLGRSNYSGKYSLDASNLNNFAQLHLDNAKTLRLVGRQLFN